MRKIRKNREKKQGKGRDSTVADVGRQAYPDNKQVMGVGEAPMKEILVDRRISKVNSQIKITPTAQYRVSPL